MFCTRSMLQLGTACLMLLAFFALFSFSDTRSITWEPTIVSGSGDVRFDRSRIPPPDFNSAQLKVNADEPADDPIWDTQNSTLGFQKIFAVSMPHRSDKRDYLALMSIVSHLEIDFIDGVNGSMMHPHALPAFWKGATNSGNFGCWRAHLNIYQYMVQNRIQSALIIEDDSDWDVLLKSQMLSFARGVRAIQNTTLPVHSPYGDSWNLLTVGHLGVNNQPTKEQRYYVTHDDPTTIGAERRDFWGKPDVSAEKLQGNYTRYVMEVYTMRGTGAYALSLRGAARLLYDQSILPNAQPIDVAISDVCRHDTWKEPFCLGVYPPIFGLFRSIGPMDKDSDRRADIKAAKDESKEAPVEPPVVKMRKEATSKLTVFPASLNIEKLLRGETVFQTFDPAGDMMSEIDTSTFQYPRGELVTVQPEEYAPQPEI